MPIDPEDLYVAAQNLSRMKPPLVSDEVCARTMLNRMSYAAYLATREAVRVQRNDPSFDVTHATLTKALMTAADVEVKDIGSRLRALKSAREARTISHSTPSREWWRRCTWTTRDTCSTTWRAWLDACRRSNAENGIRPGTDQPDGAGCASIDSPGRSRAARHYHTAR